ncbi:MAG: DUF1553 domain-containing protein, partial [Chthonomonadales bacterium]
RQSLYLFRKRNVRLPMMALFDQPDMMTSCAARGQTVHALQALNLINSDKMREFGYQLAQRVVREKSTEAGRLDRLFALTFNRPLTPAERKSTLSYLHSNSAFGENNAGVKSPNGIDQKTFRKWADLCLAVLNMNEFIYER